jgi:hypothetical protein
MTAEERAQTLITARMLEAMGRLDLLSAGLTLLAAASILFGSSNIVAGVVAIVLGVVVKLYGIRIAFDAALLRDIALDKLTSADLDAAFPNKAGRAWSERLRGCRRLVIVYVVTTIAQCMAVIAMSVT